MISASNLHVIAVYSNPRRWVSRARLAREFIARMLDAGVSLTFVEHAFGERPFEFLHVDPRVNLVQVRGGANQEIWLKEALAKIGFSRIRDSDWKYAALIDADVQFQDPNWATETIHMLQHYRVGQPWTNVIDLGPTGNIVTNEHGNSVDRSFSAAWTVGDIFDDDGAYGFKRPVQGSAMLVNQGTIDARQHCGYAWAFRRDAYDNMGGLMDWVVTGSADWYMAKGFAGQLGTFGRNLSPGYFRRLQEFAVRCERHIKQDIGCLPGVIAHHWHGKKKERFYVSRHDIVIESKFDPDIDLAWDSQGLPGINSDNRVLRDGLRRYMAMRNEDSTDTV